MKSEIVEIIKKKGILLDKDVFSVIDNIFDKGIAGDILDRLIEVSGQKMITKSVLIQNLDYVNAVINKLPGEQKYVVEKTFIKLGIQLEVRKEKEVVEDIQIEDKKILEKNKNYEIFCFGSKANKKIDVSDFIGHFRSRYQQLQRMLMYRRELQNLSSIGKISRERKNLSVIGLIRDKRVTKNKNLILTIEDLTGKINVLVKGENEELYKIGEELQLDEVVAFRCSGNNEFLFAYEIYFPEAYAQDKVCFDEDICAAFISDLHCGSKGHLGAQFESFLDWINSEDACAKKVRYLFVVGDSVDGVGVFPSQEELLELKSMKEQYSLVASYLKRIPKTISIFLCPGQHDAVRVAEPQPTIEKKYAEELFNLENVVFVSNPAMIHLLEGEKVLRVLMYHGASIHSFIDGIKELREMNAHKCPAKAIKHMLKRRHLAPTHSDVSYIPSSENDSLVISEVPDIFCTGEVHRLDIETYNKILIITGSCWQSQTSFQEKVGNVPDPCKVPVLNLKTRELKIFDFSGGDEK